jgi:outer membrane cobalamin receptor
MNFITIPRGLAARAFAVFPLCHAAQETEDIYELEEVSVTATRAEKRVADSPVATEIISGEEMKNLGACPKLDP